MTIIVLEVDCRLLNLGGLGVDKSALEKRGRLETTQ